MRVFKTFPEAFEEIRRDLKEMGTQVQTKSMQNKNIEGNPDFVTLELQNFCYTVLEPSISHLSPTQPWADEEFKERIAPAARQQNPGEAYKLRPEVWNELLEDDQFHYTYGERFTSNSNLTNVIRELARDLNSRRAFCAVWDPFIDSAAATDMKRVPCSLGYHFMYRNGKLNVTYFMRSCDFSTHFQNDVYLACRLLDYVCTKVSNRIDRPVLPGTFTQWMSSLHVYGKDVKDVF